MQWVFEGVVILSMVLVNAVFAAYEMALASVSLSRLEALVQVGRRGARSALRMKGQLERSLAVVQVGITLASSIAAATGGVGAGEHFAPVLARVFGFSDRGSELLAITLFVLPLSAVTIVFAELVPKMFAIRNKEFVALSLSPAMRGVSYVVYPAIAVLEMVVKRILRFGEERGVVPESFLDEKVELVELKAAASLARSSRMIGALEEKIVHAAARLSVRVVREVMVPLDDLSMIPDSASLAEALIAAHMHMHTRYPTCAVEGDPQTIGGYVNFKDIVSALKINPRDPGLRSIIRPIKRIEATVVLSHALEQMIRENAHIACVVGADGSVAGLITLENILEELVGDIGDEYDRLPTHIHALSSGWIAGGGVPVREIVRLAGLPEQVGVSARETLAEWCDAHAAGALNNGDMVRHGGLECMVRKMRRRRLMEAVVRRSDEGQSAPIG